MKSFLTERLDEKGSVVRVIAVAEEIRNVEARLIGNSELSKRSSSYLAHFVNFVTIACCLKERSILTGFQKIVAEGFFSTHKLDQAWDVVEDAQSCLDG